MVTPDYKTFLQLSREATLIPVAKTLSADLLTPVGAFLSVAAKQKYSFLLESVEGGEKIGRYTFVGFLPRSGGGLASLLDEIATKLNLDPVALRQRKVPWRPGGSGPPRRRPAQPDRERQGGGARAGGDRA